METLNLKELEQLNTLRLNIRRSMSQGEGLRRSSAKGRSAEFSGYREYVPGDDTRYVDWNAYARFDKLYIKEFMEEKEGRVSIYLDTSKSMDFGEKKKSTLMAELAEIISFSATSGRDSVYVTDLAFPTNTFKVPVGSLGVATLKTWLEKTEVNGKIDLMSSLKKAVKGRGGVAIVISDFMDEGFLANETDILRLFDYHGMKTTLIHVLSREEMEIEDDGSFQYIDSEDDDREVRITLDKYSIRDYKKALEDYSKNIYTKAKAAGGNYILCSTADPIKKLIYENLRFLFL